MNKINFKRASILAVVAISAAVSAQTDKPMMGKTLYDRIGGIHKVAAIIDAQVESLMKNKTVAMNKQATQVLMGISKPGLKFGLTALVAQATGGPQVFVGPKPTELMAMFNFSEEELNSIENDLGMTLDKMGYDVKTRAEIVMFAKDMHRNPGKYKLGGNMKPTPEGMEKNLLERLGGPFAVAVVVDDFVNQLGGDPTIGANKNVVERLTNGKASRPGLKYLVIEMICQAGAGAPYKYSGLSMAESHKGLMITEKEWAAGGKIFADTLAKYKVGQREQKELFAAVEAIRKDIVGR